MVFPLFYQMFDRYFKVSYFKFKKDAGFNLTKFTSNSQVITDHSKEHKEHS